MLIVFKIFIGILVPGATAMFAGKLWNGKVVPLVGLGWVVFVCVTRLITNFYGVYILLLGLSLLHLASIAIHLKYLVNAQNHGAKYRQIIPLLALNISIVTICHIYKPTLLGFNFYHIPSASMAPALTPGDIILVDTWHYSIKPLVKNDIVVFRLQNESPVMVKRVTNISKNIENQVVSVYLEGDNKHNSVDSRKFGWIEQDKIKGKVKFVLINLRSI